MRRRAGRGLAAVFALVASGPACDDPAEPPAAVEASSEVSPDLRPEPPAAPVEADGVDGTEPIDSLESERAALEAACFQGDTEACDHLGH